MTIFEIAIIYCNELLIFVAVPVQLVKRGVFPTQGLVKVQINGTWQYVCSDGFDDMDAAVICSMLGYSR